MGDPVPANNEHEDDEEEGGHDNSEQMKKECVPCTEQHDLAGCVSFTDNSACTQCETCKPNFGLDSDSGQCKECSSTGSSSGGEREGAAEKIEHCLTYGGGTNDCNTCATCKQGYHLSSDERDSASGEAPRCIADAGKCNQIRGQEHCEVWGETCEQCTKCEQNFKLKDPVPANNEHEDDDEEEGGHENSEQMKKKECVPCTEQHDLAGCVSYTDNSACTQCETCKPNFGLDSDSGQCKECSSTGSSSGGGAEG